ncbi:MAG: hypothetical protein R3297_10475, partial [Desulfobulbales bacterium]|nr:hypothetical protein [Desulfobulbales bacterium]
DVLGGIANLRHDLDNRPSFHTRWFLEGVCELLAKKFSRLEAPDLWGRFLARRNVDSVLADTQIRKTIFRWAQENRNSPALESNLYGAAMLILIRWSEEISVRELLALIQRQDKPLVGADLLTMMETSTGLSSENILDQGHQLGRRLLPLALQATPYLSSRM